MAIDWGDALIQLGGAYLSGRNQQPAYQQPVGYSGGLSQIQGIPDAGNGMMGQPVLGIPGADVISTIGSAGMVYDPNANCGQGKWLKKRRRRHRNLATRGDIRDLSALKGVLGQGKLLETWIATHA